MDPCTNIIELRTTMPTKNRTQSKSVDFLDSRFTWHMSFSTSTSTLWNLRAVDPTAEDTSSGPQDEGTQTPQYTVENFGKRWPGCESKKKLIIRLITFETHWLLTSVKLFFTWWYALISLLKTGCFNWIAAKQYFPDIPLLLPIALMHSSKSPNWFKLPLNIPEGILADESITRNYQTYNAVINDSKLILIKNQLSNAHLSRFFAPYSILFTSEIHCSFLALLLSSS